MSLHAARAHKGAPQPRSSVPILMYHRVAPGTSPYYKRYTVSDKAFAAQMAYLARRGYRAVDLDDLIEHRLGRRHLPRKPVIITFDDGFRDTVEHAVPILQARQFTAVFFLVAGLVGRTSAWLPAEERLDLFDWETAGWLNKNGFQIGSHARTHRRLAELDGEECLAELVSSRRIFERQLGHPVSCLCYPHGSFDDAVKEFAARAGYRLACTTRPGFVRPDADLLALPRIPVWGWDSLFAFVARLQAVWAPREWLRRGTRKALRRVRFR